MSNVRAEQHGLNLPLRAASTAHGANIRIREAMPGDLEAVACMSQAVAWETEKKDLDLPCVLAGTALLHADRDARILVACMGDDGDIVGMLTVGGQEISEWTGGQRWWWLSTGYVRPEWRRCGIARALYEAVRDLARATPGVLGLRGCVHETNVQAQARWTGFGLRPTGYLVLEERFGEGSASGLPR